MAGNTGNAAPPGGDGKQPVESQGASYSPSFRLFFIVGSVIVAAVVAAVIVCHFCCVNDFCSKKNKYEHVDEESSQDHTEAADVKVPLYPVVRKLKGRPFIDRRGV